MMRWERTVSASESKVQVRCGRLSVKKEHDGRRCFCFLEFESSLAMVALSEGQAALAPPLSLDR